MSTKNKHELGSKHKIHGIGIPFFFTTLFWYAWPMLRVERKAEPETLVGSYTYTMKLNIYRQL